MDTIIEISAYFVVFGIVFGLFDAVWLKSTSRLYKKYLGHLMRDKPNFVAAILFYVVYVSGITVLAMAPVANGGSALHAVMTAGFVGLLCYATYDLTNLATVKGWSTKIVTIDILWGAVATSVSVLITLYFVSIAVG